MPRWIRAAALSVATVFLTSFTTAPKNVEVTNLDQANGFDLYFSSRNIIPPLDTSPVENDLSLLTDRIMKYSAHLSHEPEEIDLIVDSGIVSKRIEGNCVSAFLFSNSPEGIFVSPRVAGRKADLEYIEKTVHLDTETGGTTASLLPNGADLSRSDARTVAKSITTITTQGCEQWQSAIAPTLNR